AFRDRRLDQLHYYAFDLLFLNGKDLRQVPLEERKKLLAELLASNSKSSPIHYSEHVVGNGAAFFKQGCHMKLEGIMSKRRAGIYRPGRGLDWLKVKCLQSGEFVVGGYTDPSGSRAGFGALLLGYHDPDGELIRAGKVGTGFDDRTLRSLLAK